MPERNLQEITAYLDSEAYKARRDAALSAENKTPYERYKRLSESVQAEISETSVDEPIDSLKTKTRKAVEYLYAMEVECELHQKERQKF